MIKCNNPNQKALFLIRNLSGFGHHYWFIHLKYYSDGFHSPLSPEQNYPYNVLQKVFIEILKELI